jgi:hypothetical protein
MSTPIDEKKEYRCWVTNEIIPLPRVKYLLAEGVPESRLTSLNGSNLTYRPRKMLFVDDESTYIMCDRIDETRVYAHERFGEKSQSSDDEESTATETEEPSFLKNRQLEEDEDEI